MITISGEDNPKEAYQRLADLLDNAVDVVGYTTDTYSTDEDATEQDTGDLY